MFFHSLKEFVKISHYKMLRLKKILCYSCWCVTGTTLTSVFNLPPTPMLLRSTTMLSGTIYLLCEFED